MNILVPVTDEALPAVWPAMLPLIEIGVKRHEDSYTVEGIAKAFQEGTWWPWIVWEQPTEGKEFGEIKAVAATEIFYQMSGHKIANIAFLAGHDKHEWLHLLDEIEEWAKANECCQLKMTTRKGFARHLPDYKLKHVILTKDLENGQFRPDHNSSIEAIQALDTAS